MGSKATKRLFVIDSFVLIKYNNKTIEGVQNNTSEIKADCE